MVDQGVQRIFPFPLNDEIDERVFGDQAGTNPAVDGRAAENIERLSRNSL